jgi:hypothetical protein
MKTEQHVAPMGADLAIQLMLATLFRIVADLADDPNLFLSEVRNTLNDLAASHPLPQLPADAEKEVRDAAQTVIAGVMTNAGAPQVH